MALINLINNFQNNQNQKHFKFIFRPVAKSNNDLFDPDQSIVSIDATFTEIYQLGATITDNEVESGSVLSDHIHTQPQRIKIRGAISEAPFQVFSTTSRSAIQYLTSGVSSFLNPILQGAEKRISVGVGGYLSDKFLNPLFNESGRSNVQQTYWNSFLKSNFKAGRPFMIQTDVDVLENVFFESITWDRKYSDGDALIFEATLKEIRVVRSEVLISKLPSAQVNSDIGQIRTQTVQGSIEDVVSEHLPIINKARDSFDLLSKNANKGLDLIKGVLSFF